MNSVLRIVRLNWLRTTRVKVRKNCSKEKGDIKATECVNRQIAGRTQQEWKLDNPEQAREYYERGKARARAYYHKHKEEIIEKRRLNEEKIIEQRLLKVECPFCKR